MAPHPFLTAAWVSPRPGLSRALQQEGAAAARDARAVVHRQPEGGSRGLEGQAEGGLTVLNMEPRWPHRLRQP